MPPCVLPPAPRIGLAPALLPLLAERAPAPLLPRDSARSTLAVPPLLPLPLAPTPPAPAAPAPSLGPPAPSTRSSPLPPGAAVTGAKRPRAGASSSATSWTVNCSFGASSARIMSRRSPQSPGLRDTMMCMVMHACMHGECAREGSYGCGASLARLQVHNASMHACPCPSLYRPRPSYACARRPPLHAAAGILACACSERCLPALLPRLLAPSAGGRAVAALVHLPRPCTGPSPSHSSSATPAPAAKPLSARACGPDSTPAKSRARAVVYCPGHPRAGSYGGLAPAWGRGGR